MLPKQKKNHVFFQVVLVTFFFLQNLKKFFVPFSKRHHSVTTPQIFKNELKSFMSHQIFINLYYRVLVPSMVYDKLYSYLLHCFNHWPLDGTFRMVC